MAAAAAGVSLTISARSRLDFFRPQAGAGKEKPRGRWERDGPRRRSADRSAARERGLEREHGAEVAAEEGGEFLQTVERHFADGFSFLFGGAQHFSDNFVRFTKWQPHGDKIISNLGGNERGILRGLA